MTSTPKPYRIQHVRPLTDDVFVVRTERRDFPLRAGQHVTLGARGSGVNREYSVYSGERDPYLEFLVKIRPGSVVGRSLRDCGPGDEVDISGPYGAFSVHAPDTGPQRYLFIATGVGIAPFHSFVTTHPSLDYQLLHGVRRVTDCYDAACYAPDRYTACTTEEAAGTFHGRVTDYLRDYPVAAGTLCYICGGSQMISDVFDLLRAQHVPSDNLFAEVFN